MDMNDLKPGMSPRYGKKCIDSVHYRHGVHIRSCTHPQILHSSTSDEVLLRGSRGGTYLSLTQKGKILTMKISNVLIN